MLLVLFTVILFRYNILFKITVNGEEIGYVANKSEIENEVNNYIESKEEGVAFRNLEAEVKYESKFVSKKSSNKDDVLEKIKENISTVYTAYGITIDDQIQTYVKTEEEADKIVLDLQNEYKDKLVLNIGVKQIFEKEKIETEEKNVAIAKIKIENLDKKVAQKEEEAKQAKVAGKPEKKSSNKVDCCSKTS